jgi:capsular exopolysaccharide synthesis family protein
MSKTYEALKKAEAERKRRTEGASESPHSEPEAITNAFEASSDSGTSSSSSSDRSSWSPSQHHTERAAPVEETGPTPFQETNGHSVPHAEARLRELTPNLEAQYQRLFTTVVQAQMPQPLKTLMVVGANHGDGVTTSASFFARALAKSRMVLLVDANLRTPALAEIFHVRSHEGFADFLARKVTLDGAITPTEEPNLFIMTSGSAAFAPPYLFEAGAFDELLTGLKEKFDYIIFDAAPLVLHLDSVFLASRVDGVILVVKAEATQVDVGLAIKKRLGEAGARFLGVVVNQTQNYVPQALRQLLA